MARRVAVGLLLAGLASGFSPFAAVEELKPQRLDQFCSSEAFPSQDGKFQLRKCSHTVTKRLEDGGDVTLAWKMHVDPDSILSLDTEAEHGVRLKRCSPNSLELELPESHARHAAEGKIVVGSRFVHNCQHLTDRHLYHRITEVKPHEWKEAAAGGPSSRWASVHVSTQELPNFAHAVELLDFSFSYMPVEARDLVAFPKMRTDFGLNREGLRRAAEKKEQPEERRLSLFPSLSGMLKKLENAEIEGVQKDDGNFHSGGHSEAHISTDNDLLNLMPKQVSNFGWNWDFNMNSTEEPTFNVSGPGTQGFFMLKHPFIKIHAGIYVNFTSNFFGPFSAPRVKWTAGIKGHGNVQGRIIAALNTTGDAGVDPTSFKSLDLPILERLKTPVWFRKIDFSTGNMPISIEPGWQMKAKLYHNGEFKGAAVFGGKTHGTMNPSLSFDSLEGFTTNWKGELIDTDVWPPMWIIFTRRFEMGLMMRPSLLMRGDMFGLEQATAAIDAAPYVNLTIRREGSNSSATVAADAMKKLTVYPFRVMGLDNVEFHTKYTVKVTAGGQTIATSPQINWGQVQFRDHVSKFDFGSVPEKAVLEQGITVTLVEVRDASDPILPASEKELGSGSVKCTSLLNGECQPSPAVANILSSSGQVIASVQLIIVWKDTPQPWFASKIRGISLSFPQVVLRQDKLASSAKNPTLRLVHGGKTYTTDIAGDVSSQQSGLVGAKTFEFTPSFMDTWLPCPRTAQKCESPKLELYGGGQLLASASVPQLDWASQTAMQGASGSSGFLDKGGSELNVPTTVALRAPGSEYQTVAVVKMNARVFDPSLSSLFLEPRSGKQVLLNAQENIKWLISDVDVQKTYSFTISALKLVEGYETEGTSYKKIGDLSLVPVSASSQDQKLKCDKTPIPGMSDDEAPCSFSYGLTFDKKAFEEGTQVVINVAWSDGSSIHEMYTPAYEIVSKISRRRRLQELEEVEDVGTPGRRLAWTAESWNKHIADNKDKCAEKDLVFKLGEGLLVRGRMDSFGMPKGFPMLGGLDETPVMTTGWRSIAGIKEGRNASDLLPDILCDGGLCQGALPGCREAQFKQLHFPKLVFNFNRPYHYNKNSTGKFSKTIHEVLAYAFSTLPEMVDITIKELNQTNHLPWKKKEHQWSTGSLMDGDDTPLHRLAYPSKPQGSNLNSGSGSTWSLPAQPPTQLPKPDAEGVEAYNRWWSGPRRLQTPAKVMMHQVELRFKVGVPFTIDRELIQMMLEHGYFMDIEDDASKELGPLKITDFHIDHSGGHVESTEPSWRSLLQSVSGMAALLGVAGASLILFGAFMSRSLTGLRSSKRSFLGVDGAEEAEGLE